MAENMPATPDTELFSDIFNASPIGIAVETLEGQPFFVNRAFCRFLGFSEEELRSKHCVDFSPPEDAEKDWALFQQLRAGSIDHYQLDKRYFRRDGSLVWGRLSLSLLNNRPSPLAIAMVEDITEEKAALDREHGLLDTLGLVTKQMAAAVSRCSRDFRYLWVNQAYAGWLQRPLIEVVGRPMVDVLGKEAFEALMPHFKRVLTGEIVRYEQETNFQSIGRRWTSATYTPTLDGSGAVNGWVAVVLDITDRKQAEQGLADMSRKLIEAQEQERARIGRELHDDINQQIAMLAVELEQLQNDPSDVQNRLQELRKQMGELSNDVQALSHELHSSKLEYLGVVAGIKSWCREFGERQRMEVEFKSDVVSVLPLDVGVCFFRVLQEALHNAVKYSGAKRVEVQLAEHSNEVHLIIRDSGRGFDIEAARQGRGLGLTSMQERVRLVSGTISIESKPMGGTTIHVRVPFSFDGDSMRAVG